MITSVDFEKMLARARQEPDDPDEWNRTALARAVSTWLLAYRAKRHMTQAQLARKLEWHQPGLARLEAGKYEPSITTLRRISDRLNVPISISVYPKHIDVVFLQEG